MAPNGYAVVGVGREAVERAGRVRVRCARPAGRGRRPSVPRGPRLDESARSSVAIAASGDAAVAWEEVTSPSTFDVACRRHAACRRRRSRAPEMLTGVDSVESRRSGIARRRARVTLLYAAAPAPSCATSRPARRRSRLRPAAARGELLARFGEQLAVAPSGDAVARLRTAAAPASRCAEAADGPSRRPSPDNIRVGRARAPRAYDAAGVAIDAAGTSGRGAAARAHASFDLAGFCLTISDDDRRCRSCCRSAG